MIGTLLQAFGLISYLYNNREILIFTKNVLYRIIMNIDLKKIKYDFKIILKNVIINTSKNIRMIENFI